MHERAARVFAFLEELFAGLPVPPDHRELLRAHLSTKRELAMVRPEILAVQLPLLVHEAITGDDRPALPVAAACTLLYAGADLFDSMLDHELEPPWHTRGPAETNLAAATLLAALPQLSIAYLRERGTPPARLWTLAQLFADTLLTMSAGQHEDLLLPTSENVSLEDSRAMVERKSGSATALWARAGAVQADGDPSIIQAYAAFGSCFGVARQLINDVWGIWGKEPSRDLLNGKCTLPIVHALATLGGEKRRRLQKLLAASRESAVYHDEARALMVEAGSVRYTALIVWLYQEQARSHLAAALPREPAARELRMLLDRASLTPRPQGARLSD